MSLKTFLHTGKTFKVPHQLRLSLSHYHRMTTMQISSCSRSWMSKSVTNKSSVNRNATTTTGVVGSSQPLGIINQQSVTQFHLQETLLSQTNQCIKQVKLMSLKVKGQSCQPTLKLTTSSMVMLLPKLPRKSSSL